MHFVLFFFLIQTGRDGQSTKNFSNLRNGGRISIFYAVPREHRQVFTNFWYFDHSFPCVDSFTFFSPLLWNYQKFPQLFLYYKILDLKIKKKKLNWLVDTSKFYSVGTAQEEIHK